MTRPRRDWADAEVMFRGELREVTIDDVTDEPDVNAYGIEWHFTGMSADENNALGITDAEDDQIVEQLWPVVHDRRSDD